MRSSKRNVLFSLVAVLLSGSIAMAQQAQTKEEYDAYVALYNEEDPAAKAELGQAFVADYPDSEYAPIAYQLLVATHYSQRDWRNLLDAANRFDRADFPNLENETKAFIYQRAMAAAQQENAPLDILDFGDKILDLDRNNLAALLTLPPVILDNLPDFGSARERNLARAFELANRARVRAQSAYPISAGDAQREAQRIQVYSRIYLYLGQVHELRGDDQRAAAEYSRILEYDPRSSDAYLRIGLAYQRQAAALSAQLPRVEPEPGAVEVNQGESELPPEQQALQEAALGNLELAIDNLASASALGGQAADLATRALDDLARTQDPASWSVACETDPGRLLCRMSPEASSGDLDVAAGEGLTVAEVIAEKRRSLN